MLAVMALLARHGGRLFFGQMPLDSDLHFGRNGALVAPGETAQTLGDRGRNPGGDPLLVAILFFDGFN
jgi:hypothetical protein